MWKQVKPLNPTIKGNLMVFLVDPYQESHKSLSDLQNKLLSYNHNSKMRIMLATEKDYIII